MAKMHVLHFFIFLFVYQRVVSYSNYETKAHIVAEVQECATALDKLLNFTYRYYDEINFDGALGLVLAEANLYMTNVRQEDLGSLNILDYLIHKIKIVKSRILKGLKLPSRRYRLFGNYLLQSSFWSNDLNFNFGLLADYGLYNYTVFRKVISETNAVYKGINSDECLEEILKRKERETTTEMCYVNPKCREMMLNNRVDVSYLLTHRLFYLQILKSTNCTSSINFSLRARRLCSLILREAKTNEQYGFPQHDLFLEQVLFCGMEGFSEFLIPTWRRQIVLWQSSQGCYENRPKQKVLARSENNISYGCTDHTTGLGAAVLALNLRFLISQLHLIN